MRAFTSLALTTFCVSVAFTLPVYANHSTEISTVNYSQPNLPPPVEITSQPKFAPLELSPYPYMPMGTYPNPFPSSQCTAGAASMKGNITWRGNANRWDDEARARGITVSSTPIVGAVAQTDRGSAGHVAVVTGVRPGEVLITERNYDYRGSVRTSWQAVGRYVYLYL